MLIGFPGSAKARGCHMCPFLALTGGLKTQLAIHLAWINRVVPTKGEEGREATGPSALCEEVSREPTSGSTVCRQDLEIIQESIREHVLQALTGTWRSPRKKKCQVCPNRLTKAVWTKHQ